MTAMEECPCWTCIQEVKERQAEETGEWWRVLPDRMILCPDCGNKRCPKATHHDNACGRSNEPGQAGSRYPKDVWP